LDPALPLDRGCAPPLDLDCDDDDEPDGATRLCCAGGGAGESFDPPDDRSAPAELDPEPDEPPDDAGGADAGGGDDGGLERGTACAAAQRGVASAIATAATKRMRVGLAIRACPSQASRNEAFPLPIVQLYCQFSGA
jgi:hypothetical protein